MSLISCDNITVRFRQHGSRQLLRDHVQNAFSRRQGNDFFALRDVSLTVEPGEGIAILGQNGAGKSTLLGVLGGLLRPDAGNVLVAGGVSLLLELGAGFHFELTGRENLLLNGAVIGFRRREIEALAGSIIEFAELADFIDEPLRTYSAGMMMRLAFAIAVHADMNPILLVDEILAVGDAAFQQKCRERIRIMRRDGKTLICVSHQPATLADVCDRAVWIHQGRKVRDGAFEEVSRAYTEFMTNPDRQLGDTIAG